jgi:hypothetical protein
MSWIEILNVETRQRSAIPLVDSCEALGWISNDELALRKGGRLVVYSLERHELKTIDTSMFATRGVVEDFRTMSHNRAAIVVHDSLTRLYSIHKTAIAQLLSVPYEYGFGVAVTGPRELVILQPRWIQKDSLKKYLYEIVGMNLDGVESSRASISEILHTSGVLQRAELSEYSLDESLVLSYWDDLGHGGFYLLRGTGLSSAKLLFEGRFMKVTHIRLF